MSARLDSWELGEKGAQAACKSKRGTKWVYSRRLPCHVRPVIAFGCGIILVKEEPGRDIF